MERRDFIKSAGAGALATGAMAMGCLLYTSDAADE